MTERTPPNWSVLASTDRSTQLQALVEAVDHLEAAGIPVLDVETIPTSSGGMGAKIAIDLPDEQDGAESATDTPADAGETIRTVDTPEDSGSRPVSGGASPPTAELLYSHLEAVGSIVDEPAAAIADELPDEVTSRHVGETLRGASSPGLVAQQTGETDAGAVRWTVGLDPVEGPIPTPTPPPAPGEPVDEELAPAIMPAAEPLPPLPDTMPPKPAIVELSADKCDTGLFEVPEAQSSGADSQGPDGDQGATDAPASQEQMGNLQTVIDDVTTVQDLAEVLDVSEQRARALVREAGRYRDLADRPGGARGRAATSPGRSANRGQ